jgi:hypothetical protein
MPRKRFQKWWLINHNILTFKANQRPGSISRGTSWSITRSCVLSTGLQDKFMVLQALAMLLPLQMRALIVSQSCLTRLQKLDVFMKIAEPIQNKLEERLICQFRSLLAIIIAPLILLGPPEEASMLMTSYVLLIIVMMYDWLANTSTAMCKQLVVWILFPE